MAWTTLLNALFLVGKPITSAIGLALRDNMVAIAEGATGAPRIQPRALATYAGRADLTPGSGSPTPVAFIGLDPQAVLLIDCYVASTNEGASLSLQMSGSGDGGDTWYGWVNFLTLTGESRQGGTQMVDLKAGGTVGGTLGGSVTSLGGPAINALRFRAVTTGGGTPTAKVLLHYAGEAL